MKRIKKKGKKVSNKDSKNIKARKISRKTTRAGKKVSNEDSENKGK